MVSVTGFSHPLRNTGTDLAPSNSRVLFLTVMYEGGTWSKFRTRSFRMSCHLIRAWIFRLNVNYYSFSILGEIGIFEIVAIRHSHLSFWLCNFVENISSLIKCEYEMSSVFHQHGSLTCNNNSLGLGNSVNYIVTDGCIFKS